MLQSCALVGSDFKLHVANDSSNLFHRDVASAASSVRYPMLQVHTGLEKPQHKLSPCSNPLALTPACLQRVVADPLVILMRMC